MRAHGEYECHNATPCNRTLPCALSVFLLYSFLFALVKEMKHTAPFYNHSFYTHTYIYRAETPSIQ